MFRVSKFTNTVCKGPFRRKARVPRLLGSMKERRAQEGKGSGHSRVGEEQTVPPSNPLWSSWLPGTIPHWGPLSGFEWEGRREGFGFPPLSPQGQWRMGRRALVTHRLASSWTLGLETDGSVNSQGIPRSSSWV